MDFVQRNLINERNNLQIELAKAKLLIAQLNENAHVNAVHDALDDAEKHYDPQHGPIGKSYRNDAIPHFKIARAALDAAKATGVEGKHLDKANARYNEMMGMMPKEGHDYGPGFGGVWVPKGSYDEQTEYISSLENAVIALAESMNVSAEDLLREGRARFERLNRSLDKNLKATAEGSGRLDAMINHVTNVRNKLGPLAARAADSGLDAARARTTGEVNRGYKKVGNLHTALDISRNQQETSTARRVARDSFSPKKDDRNRGSAMGRLGPVIPSSRPSDVLADRGQLPEKKFGTGADQRTNLRAMRIDSAAKRAAQAQAQSTAARARNQANRLNEVRAVSDAEIAANPLKNARNINRVRAVMDRIHNRTQTPGYHNAAGSEKDAYDSERAKHMLRALGVNTRVRSSGVGVAVASERRPNEAGEALTRDTNVQMGSHKQSDRAVGALRANNMSSNRANRPAGPVADTTQRRPQGMQTFLPRSL